MVISFQRVKEAREAKQAYRSILVAKILTHYGKELEDGKSEFYLEHIKNGFPIHVLEGIAERLEVAGH